MTTSASCLARLRSAIRWTARPLALPTGFLANGGIPFQATSGITVLDQATARANTSTFLPNDVKYPLSLSWNLGVQHVFKSNYTAEVRYVGTRGEDLNVQNRLNVINVVTPPITFPLICRRPRRPHWTLRP